MAAPQNEYAFDLAAAIDAARRWAAREDQHARFERAARRKEYWELDTPERRALRARRLMNRLRRSAPEVAEALTAEFAESAVRRMARAAVAEDVIEVPLQERVIGKTRDFLFVEFFDQGMAASRAVGRVVTRLGGGRVSLGTGFMVSPRLLMTNHHVLASRDDAAISVVEFDFQRDRFRQPVAVRTFALDPASFFLNDAELDFALVAVSPGGAGRPLGAYGWCPLIKELGKITVGEPINIVQHPKGEMKQVVIRDNRLIDLPDDTHAHYEADTEPGSSGSPVFNGEWEVVALHHSGVPRRSSNGEPLRVDGRVWRQDLDPPELIDWVGNEGIRVSRLVEFIAAARVRDDEVPLLEEFLAAAKPPVPSIAPIASDGKERPMLDTTRTAESAVTVTVPLRITISLGAPSGNGSGVVVSTDSSQNGRDELALERVEPDPGDPDYKRRPGYQPGFLGFQAPFPRLTNASRPKAFALAGLTGDGRFELKYHHYSAIMNKERKLAFVAGVNYDPTAPVQHPRDKDGDKWYFDPRVSGNGAFQAGEGLYAGNPLDRGHLVRRADAGWGATKKEAKLANDDTFHFTNCSPQHEITNQGQVTKAPPGLKLWGKLEDHVAEQGKENSRRLSVFNGPVFRTSDRVYRGVKIPKEFWKVIVYANDAGDPSAAAFVLSQALLIAGLEEEFQIGEYKTVQVRVKDLEVKTNLDFGPFRGWDVLEQDGAEERFVEGAAAIVLESVEDAVV